MDLSALITTSGTLPVPWGWFQLLLFITLFLHIILMNTIPGTGILSLVNHCRSDYGPNPLTCEILQKLPFSKIFILLPFCFLASGCAIPENQGKMVRTVEVEQLVESATVLQDHTYYFTGPEAQPDVIIAIDNSITLKSKYWIKVDDVEKNLMDWNRQIDNAHRFKYRYEGFRIMTPDGNQAGIWYSKYDYTFVQFPDPSTIILYTPSNSRPGRSGSSWGTFGGEID